MKSTQINGLIRANPRTIRSALENLQDAGFVVEDGEVVDSRYKRYKLTPKAVQKMDEYCKLVSRPLFEHDSQ
jgi:DNA-binding PadR family transcriptional regulator